MFWTGHMLTTYHYAFIHTGKFFIHPKGLYGPLGEVLIKVDDICQLVYTIQRFLSSCYKGIYKCKQVNSFPADPVGFICTAKILLASWGLYESMWKALF